MLLVGNENTLAYIALSAERQRKVKEKKMATPHINAEMGAFADVVLMPGDPLRAKYIAETFLEDVVQVLSLIHI